LKNKNVNGFFPEIMFTVFLTTFLYTARKYMLQESSALSEAAIKN
jgi:hypothetical protein